MPPQTNLLLGIITYFIYVLYINIDVLCMLFLFQANGFLGAPGPAGGIPLAYSLIAKKYDFIYISSFWYIL